VALAGQGVTATTAVGRGPRYGLLEVDSNLPDVRIAVGPPEENAFTAAVLQAADEAYRVEFDKQLAANGTARLWVPAARALREVWQPSADLTGVLDLPVLVVAGDEEVALLAADLADAVVEVNQVVDPMTPGEPTLDDYTVGVVNTGMPSFAVDTAGGLNLAILRSCTGWPSGVWIDPPRRTAPDGSTFQQQHWTHHYDYALVTGAGDWRTAGLVRAGHQLNHPLRTSSAVGTLGAGQRRGQYLAVDGDVLVTAVKATGNPLADGREPGPVDALTVRLVEPLGATSSVRIRAGFPITGTAELDLLERAHPDAPADRGGTVDLGAMDVRTLRLGVPPAAGTVPLTSDVEPHQPVYTRYWLDNTGPAPRGNLPVTVHVEPPVVEPSGPYDLTVRVASDRTDETVDVPVRLVVPDGWRVDPPRVDAIVLPGEYVETAVRVIPPDRLADGIWWVRAQAETGGQVVEDVSRALVGANPPPELTVDVRGPAPLRPGEAGSVQVNLASSARTDVSARVQLISPWHTWELLPSWDTGVDVVAGGSATLNLPVDVPASTTPGAWWVVVKVAAAGLLHYSEPVELVVR
jgi:alpha-mannosidase